MSKQDQLGKNETFCVKWGQNTYLALSSWAWSWSHNAGGHAWSHLLQILHHASSSPPPASVPSPACSSFSPIKHTSYITYILEWTFLYWSFRLWDVIRDFSRLFCSDIRAKSEFHLSNLSICPIKSRRWRKVHYPCHIKLSQMKKKNPMKSMAESACLQWMFWAFDWRNSPRRPSLFQIDTSQITQMSDKNLLSYLNWKSRISGQTPIDRYCSNLLWVSNPHFALKSVDGVLLRKHLFLVYFLNSNGKKDPINWSFS